MLIFNLYPQLDWEGTVSESVQFTKIVKRTDKYYFIYYDIISVYLLATIINFYQFIADITTFAAKNALVCAHRTSR